MVTVKRNYPKLTEMRLNDSLQTGLQDILRNSFFIRTTTQGKRTGRPHTIETTYVWDGDRTIYLSGYPGPRDWVSNVTVNPVVVVQTVEGQVSYEIGGLARVLRTREERLPHLLAFIEHWAERGATIRPVSRLALGALRLNRALRLPWWGPFYFARRILDRMPCVEIVLTGVAVQRSRATAGTTS